MKRKQFSKAFKVEAVRLLEQRNQTGAALARELGVRRNQLYKWRRELELHGERGAFNGPGRNAALAELSDIQSLKRRIQQLEEENAILKKARAYFTGRRQ